ncbi:MAG: hypothetical protein H6728_14005 [Myxococcales bacterium]|nr:hypothetical protein [Myxococcales bacterium]MCB9644185.1 hypothetical protein [Myxococcales bacterium]
MQGQPTSRKTGAVWRSPETLRTLTGGQFSEERNQRIEIDGILPEDQLVVQAATELLRLLFPQEEWASWSLEIVEGHDHLAEVLLEEQTLIVDRLAIHNLPLLSWELFGAWLQYQLSEEFGWLKPEEIPLFSMWAQLRWFSQEGIQWQEQLFTSLRELPIQTGLLEHLLWSLLSETRSARLRMRLQGPWPDVDPFSPYRSLEDRLWQAAAHELSNRLGHAPLSPEQWAERRERLRKLRQQWDVRMPMSWDAITSPLCSTLARFVYDVPSSSSSTDRRLNLFRLCVEKSLDHEELDLSPQDWPRLSLSVLDPQRHPRIHLALSHFLEIHPQGDNAALWPIRKDESLLAQLAIQNQLSDQDDRFFRQATHLQAIWRDILHRSASQEWAAHLLFDALEKHIATIQQDQDLFFEVVLFHGPDPDQGPVPQASSTQTLCELLWILSQSPLAVLRRLYPKQREQQSTVHMRWPLLRQHLRRFVHLAPPILLRLLEQLEEERQQREQDSALPAHLHIDADPEIPQQDLHGRVLPLFSRPELQQYRWIDLERTTNLRIVYLDRYLHQSSGQLREQRFFSSFLLFFKQAEDAQEGQWNELALWIDKDLDLNKVSQKKSLSPTIRGLLLEDGLWERTYRYQFLSMEQLLQKLQPNNQEWRLLLEMLASEYRPLLEERVQEVLALQYYLGRERYLGNQTLTANLVEEHAHPLLRLSVDEFEGIKQQLSSNIVEIGIQHFLHTQLQDTRSWSSAHQAIAQQVSQYTLLLHLASNALFVTPLPSQSAQKWCWEALQQWAEHQEDWEPTPLDPQHWIQDNANLIKRLERVHPTRAVEFVGFFLQQIHHNHRIIQRIVQQPLEEQGEQAIFKPIPTSQDHPSRRREMVPYLCDPDGHLFPLMLIQLFGHIPKSLLHKTLDSDEKLQVSLSKASQLLAQSQDEEDNTYQTLVDVLEERQARQATHQAEGSTAQDGIDAQGNPPAEERPTKEGVHAHSEVQESSQSS